MSIQRKQINIRVPENLLTDIDLLCKQSELNRTQYLLTLARDDLKQRKKLTEKEKELIYGIDWEL